MQAHLPAAETEMRYDDDTCLRRYDDALRRPFGAAEMMGKLLHDHGRMGNLLHDIEWTDLGLDDRVRISYGDWTASIITHTQKGHTELQFPPEGCVCG